MDAQFVSIGKAAKMLGMSIEGLRKWERDGRLVPVRTVTNHRRYRVADLHALMQETAKASTSDRCVLYARVSAKTQQEAGHLDRQLGRLTAFATEQRWTVVAAVAEVASSLNEKRRGLHQVLDLAREQQVSRVVVEYKDRLARFGFYYLETYLRAFGVQVVTIEQEMKDDQQELVEDLLAITTSFSVRIDGKRGGKKLVATVREALNPANAEGESE